jgi:hypothetical protein
MKIIVFDNEKNVLNTFDNVLDPEPFSLSDVKWQGGGAGGISGNYVIVEDNETLDDLTDPEILDQVKYQSKLDIARRYEEKRVQALATGTEQEEETAFNNSRSNIDAATNFEEITVQVQNYKIR